LRDGKAQAKVEVILSDSINLAIDSVVAGPAIIAVN
jgi:hypothetical protein